VKLRYLIPVVVFVVLFGFFIVVLKRPDYNPSQIASPLLGKPAPVYELPSVEDPTAKVASRDFANKFHLVNVWATWCVECRHEHAMLLEIQRQNVVPIVGIDWNDNLADAQRWLSTLGNPYVATVFDSQGRTALDWGVYAAPESFLVDDKGIIRCKQTGGITPHDWETRFLPVIRGQQAGVCK
jgi:cytochrome c biogenesis protein CcmG/thiol:disulfide interchange protein DsbE